MSGHSKWASIKHKKAAKDAKRGQLFNRLIREVTVAARQGGGDVTSNAALRLALDRAKAANMGSDTIERAIKRGTGELEGVDYESAIYEAYGPGGAAVLIETLTDNKNRTASEMRYVLSRNHGTMADPGSVSYLFSTKGFFLFSKDSTTEDDLMEKLLDADIEDILTNDDGDFEVTCGPSDFERVQKVIDEAGLAPVQAEVTKLPSTSVSLEGADARKMLQLLEAIEDQDDVQNVYSNFEISAEELEAAG